MITSILRFENYRLATDTLLHMKENLYICSKEL